jgi:PAS domain S-box-containing protein
MGKRQAQWLGYAAASIAVLGGLYLARLHSYLLFHSLGEVFSIVAACGIFMVAWNARAFLQSGYLLWLGIAYLFVAVVDLVHMLAYPGMGVFAGGGTNLAAQLWVAARYLESLSLLAAALFLRRRPKVAPTLMGYAVVVALLLGSIFYWGVFPVCFNEAGRMLTGFKVTSEVVICGILAASAVLVLWRNRGQFSRGVLGLLVASMVATVASELAFTKYRDPYGMPNVVGHYLKIVSFYLIYKALIETALARPFELLFRSLKQSEEALRRSEEKYRGLYESCKDGIVFTDMGGNILDVNRAFEAMVGWSAGELRRLTHQFLTPPQWHAEEARIVLDQVVQRGYSDEYEKEYLRKDGTVFPVSVRVWLIRDEAGQPAGMWGFARDVTERKKADKQRERLIEALRRSRGILEKRVGERTKELAETVRELQGEVTERLRAERGLQEAIKRGSETSELLRESQERYRSLVELSPDAINVFVDGKFVYANPASVRLFGASSPEDLIGREMRQFVPAGVGQLAHSGGGGDGNKGPLAMTTSKIVRLDGRAVDTESIAATIAYDGRPAVLAVMRDVSQRKELEDQVTQASEAERQRIGQDLHDGLGQLLTGMGYLSSVLQRKLSDKSLPEAVEAATIAGHLKEAIKLTRSLARGLCPVDLKADGLMAALRELAAQVEETYRLRCVFRSSRPALMQDSATATHLYRIAQEAVSNAVRHGRAKHIDIDLSARKEGIVLTVEDDGVGIPPDRNEMPPGRGELRLGDLARGGMGLRIMDYRARAIGGRLDIGPRDNGGTRVTCCCGSADQEG